jgi:hypothetical protein
MIRKRVYKEKDLQNKLVAFVDILGFKHLITQEKSKAIKSLNDIDSSIQHILWILKEQHQKTFSTKLFSDCICISCDDTLENVFYIIYELSYIQYSLSLEGIYVRGGLSFGDHFENNRIIFSNGLVKAYELEQTAHYPRIIIDSELIIRIFEDDENYFPYYCGFKKRDFIIESPDGHFSIDYLHMLYEEGFEQLEELKFHKEALITNLMANYNNQKIVDKYRWLAEYHNNRFNEIFASEEYEEEYVKSVNESIYINIETTFPSFKKVMQ